MCQMFTPSAGLGQRGRPVEIRDNLIDRIAEAEREGWLGEVEGLRVSLAGASDKLTQTDRRTVDATAINIGMPRRTPAQPIRTEEGTTALGQSVGDPHEIRFDCWQKQRGDGSVLVIVPRIDGAPLTELIDSFEIAAGMTPAGNAYGGLIPRFYWFGPLEDHFCGLSTDAMGPGTPLLGYECGEWGCWPLMARITVTADLVVWDSFEQPHRKTRDYTTFGPVRFERDQYDAELHALSAAIGADHT